MAASTSAGKNTSRKRKLEDEHRKFQDIWTDKYFFVENSAKNIICLICQSTVAVCKEYNLQRHYLSKHKSYEKITGELRKQKIKSLMQGFDVQKSMFTQRNKEAQDVTEISYEIANLIAKDSKAFSEGDFVKKCMIIAAQKLCPEVVKKFENISLNRMTVQRRISDLSGDIVDQLKKEANKFVYFSLALDESTDVTSTAQLLVFVRGVTDDFSVHEELVGLSSLKGQTTGSDLLRGLLEKVTSLDLNLDNLVGISTDGAPAMIGKHSGLVQLLIKHLGQRKDELKQFHCIIHQQNLCGKELNFEHVMKVVVSTVNFIKSRALHHRQFKQFLDEIEAQYGDVVFFTEVRWLSRGNTLQRFVSLLDEIVIFLNEKGKVVPELENLDWLCDLAFLVDLTSHLNNLNIKLQGNNQLISQLANHVAAFEQKLKLFQSQLTKGELGHFPTYQTMLEKHSVSHKNETYATKIGKLREVFDRRFGDFKKEQGNLKLFSNPFSVSPEDVEVVAQLELIDLQNNDNLHAKFKEGDLLNFYRCLPIENYPYLRNKAAIYASLFGSTYICEQTFSLLSRNKSNIRNRLSDENLHSILRLATTKFDPNIKKLVSESQCQVSH